MATDLDPSQLQQRRNEWMGRVSRLLDQIAGWAQAEGWAVQRESRSVTDRRSGTYEVPLLVVRLSGGELQVQPVSLHALRAEGRVDLEAYPTLNRVKLVPQGQDWEIITDSNVPLRASWRAETFVQLAKDLLA